MPELISVIVPVYNTAPYLEECICSVLGQSCQAWELLLIDDGSTDSSVALCQQLAAEDGRIRLFQQEHKGVSATRNLGLREAKGEYLFFLDSDDAIHPALLEALYSLIKAQDTAVVMVDYQDRWNDPMPEGDGRITRLSNQKVTEQLLCEEWWRLWVVIWGKLIRKSAVGAQLFDETLHNGEDTWFFYQLLAAGAEVAILHRRWYYYRQREESTSRRVTLQRYQDVFECYRRIFHAEQATNRPQGSLQVVEWLCRVLVDWGNNARAAGNQEALQLIRQFARECRAHPQFGQISLKSRLKLLLAFHCYPLYAFLHLFAHCWWLWRQKGVAPHG